MGCRNAFTLIPDFEPHLLRIGPDAHGGDFASGMTMDVGKRFLQDAEKHELRFIAEPMQIFRDLHLHMDAAALGEALHVPTHCRCQPQFVEQRWVKQIRNGAQFRGARTDHLGGLLQFLKHAVREILGVLHKPPDDHAECAEILAYAVVEFAGNSSALFILCAQQMRRYLAQALVRLLNLKALSHEERSALLFRKADEQKHSTCHEVRDGLGQFISGKRTHGKCWWSEEKITHEEPQTYGE